ncbi:MAG: bifunctional phosphopantothenoylcysteine decarboxylase/phosphopantothenate--cysteine ligase CoaBC [Bacteroidota bacterium]
MLQGKKIILGITGSIAAYKIPLLVRLLIKNGAEVQVLMTPAARDFVTPLTLSTLSLHPVMCNGFDPANGKWNSHVEMGNWADAIVLAPVTANTLGKMANGLADNLLVATYLAAKCPVYFAPAMDLDMYRHPSTQKNIAALQSYGNILIEPQEGELASGLCGAGRMEEPEQILAILAEGLKKKSLLIGKTALVTAGPTHEAIDPVRFIGNQSGGRMGIEIARGLAMRGADVTLVCGPSNIEISHRNIHLIKVTSAAEMFEKCSGVFAASDIVVMAAAVADYTPAHPLENKIKKDGKAPITLELKPTIDILGTLGKLRSANQVLAGFALETENERGNALKKLHNKNLDFIVLNSLRDAGAGFGHSTNKISILKADGCEKEFPLKSKAEVAADIIDEIENILKEKK